MAEELFEAISNNGTPPVYKYFNGNEWVTSANGKTNHVVSPVTGEVVGELQVVTPGEIDEVMKRAAVSQRAWEAVPLHQRIKIMHLAADWIRHYQDYLVNLMVGEIGKSHGEAKSEMVRTADLIDYYADEAQSLKGETLDSDNFPGFEKGRIAVIERAAYGIAVAIAPFNYPVNLSASKLAPALLMGNAVVFKPPTQGGVSGVHLARIFEKAGVPKGVISCVTGGGGEIGDYLVSHPAVNLVTFTGNSDTGMHIAQKAGMKTLVFECGGNNPAVVMPDADLTLTATEIIKGAFSYAGQRCTAIKYVLATERVMVSLLSVLTPMMEKLVKMGDPRSPETKLVGPVISEKAAEDIEAVIKDALAGGAHAAMGGKRNKAYIEPTLLTNVKPSMNVVAKETFGPVLSFITINDLAEAVTIINNSVYGLQACVFTKDEGTGLVFAQQLNVGTVQINGSPQRGPDHFPFLGVKRSGLGVQGVRYSLEAMSRLKSIVINKPQ